MNKDIIANVEKKYNEIGDTTQTVVSVNSLRYYKEIAKLIDKISVFLSKNLKQNIDLIKKAAEDCGEIPVSGEYHLTDLIMFLDILFERISKGVLYSEYQGLKRISNQMIKEKFVSPNMIKIINGKCKEPIGFSVFFSAEEITSDNEFYNTYILDTSSKSTEFSKYFKWDNFLKKYLNEIRK